MNQIVINFLLKVKKIRQQKPNLSAVLLVILLCGLAMTFFVHQTQAAIDEKEIKDVVLEAFNLTLSFGKVNHKPTDAELKDPANPEVKMNTPLADSEINSARQHAQDRFNHIFSPNCSVCKSMSAGINDGLNGEAKGVFRITDGGIKDINWKQVVVKDNEASVTVSATTWVKVLARDETNKVQAYNPEKGTVEVFTLHRADGHWQITNVLIDEAASNELPVNVEANKNAANDSSTNPEQISPSPKKPTGPETFKKDPAISN